LLATQSEPCFAQDETGQVRQLKAAGCEKVFREKITGTTATGRSLKN